MEPHGWAPFRYHRSRASWGDWAQARVCRSRCTIARRRIAIGARGGGGSVGRRAPGRRDAVRVERRRLQSSRPVERPVGRRRRRRRAALSALRRRGWPVLARQPTLLSLELPSRLASLRAQLVESLVGRLLARRGRRGSPVGQRGGGVCPTRRGRPAPLSGDGRDAPLRSGGWSRGEGAHGERVFLGREDKGRRG